MYLCRQADIDTGLLPFMYLCLLSSTSGTLPFGYLQVPLATLVYCSTHTLCSYFNPVSMLFQGFMVHMCLDCVRGSRGQPCGGTLRVCGSILRPINLRDVVTLSPRQHRTNFPLEYWTATNQIQFSMRTSSQHPALALSWSTLGHVRVHMSTLVYLGVRW